MSETILDELIRRLHAVKTETNFFVGRCPYCGGFVGFDQEHFYCEFCPPNAALQEVNPALLPLVAHRKEVFQVFVRVASIPDPQYGEDRCLFFHLVEDYVPGERRDDQQPPAETSPEVQQKIMQELLQSCRTGSLADLLAKARSTRQVLRPIPVSGADGCMLEAKWCEVKKEGKQAG